VSPDHGNETRRRTERPDLPDPTLFWRWVGSATRPVVGWALIVLGGILVTAGYFGVSRESLVAKQLPYLVSGGIGGMVLIAIGAFFLGTEDLRKDLRRLDRVEAMVEELHGALLVRLGDTATRTGTATNGQARAALVVLPRGRSFHRADCTMVDGKETERVTLDDTRTRNLEPCSLCEPELAHA